MLCVYALITTGKSQGAVHRECSFSHLASSLCSPLFLTIWHCEFLLIKKKKCTELVGRGANYVKGDIR